METRRHNRKGQRGQAGLEFIFVVIVVFFFLLFFLSMAMMFVLSDYVEYATFMAARTYKASMPIKSQQEQLAQRVFNDYISKISGLLRGTPSLEFLDDGLRSGVRANYAVDMFYLPPMFLLDGQPPSRINLSTETRLGRDVTLQECTDYIDSVGQSLGVSGRDLEAMRDNGC